MRITAAVHDDINLWQQLILLLAERPTHIQEIYSNKPTWIGATDVSLKVMGSICRRPTGEWHLLILAVDISSKRRLLMDDNPGGDLTIKGLELDTYLAHLHLYAPNILPPNTSVS